MAHGAIRYGFDRTQSVNRDMSGAGRNVCPAVSTWTACRDSRILAIGGTRNAQGDEFVDGRDCTEARWEMHCQEACQFEAEVGRYVHASYLQAKSCDRARTCGGWPPARKRIAVVLSDNRQIASEMAPEQRGRLAQNVRTRQSIDLMRDHSPQLERNGVFHVATPRH